MYYTVAVVFQFTVFKHRQMICASLWTNIDVSVFATYITCYRVPLCNLVHLGSFNGDYGFCDQPSSVRQSSLTLAALKP